jgi:Na+/H+-dicarboxylate symporter
VAWLVAFLLMCVIIGVAIGVVWAKVVTPPEYVVGKDGSATITQRGLTEVFGSDAWFAVIGFVISLGIGVIAWRWFGKLGWPVVIVTILGALVAAAVCWYVGYHVGPGDLTSRMAAAKPGDRVAIPVTVRSPVTLVAWALGGIIPVLLCATLGRDEEEATLPPPKRRHRRQRFRRRRNAPGTPSSVEETRSSGPPGSH